MPRGLRRDLIAAAWFALLIGLPSIGLDEPSLRTVVIVLMLAMPLVYLWGKHSN
jgi:hypothetical protein